MSKQTKPMHLNIPISKIDEEKRMVWGYATVEEIDKHGEIIGYDASKQAFAEWPGNIREMHGDKAVGKGIEVEFDDKNKGVWLGAYVSESADGENAWIKVKEKILNGFSIGGRINDWTTTRQKVEGEEKDVVMITDYDLSEVSLVDNPACPSAVFQMVKSVGGKLKHVEKMENRGGIPVMWFEKAYAIEPRQFISKSNTHYNKDSMGKNSNDIAKGVWSAQELVDLGSRLAGYIWMESWDGKESELDGLKNALEEIKAAASEELLEPENWPEPMGDAVELAMQTLGLTKDAIGGTTMGKKDIDKSVTGDEDRDANAEVVTTAEENGRPADDTKERADAVVDAPKDDVVVEDDKDTEVTEDDASAEDGGDSEDEAPKKGKKSDEATDLSKSTDTNELVKTFGTMIKDAVKEAVAPLEDRIKSIEGQPAPSKAKAGYTEVEKSEKVETEQSKLSDELNDIMKRADELAENPSASTQAERVKLAQRARVIQRMLDPKSVAEHAAIKASF